LALISIDIFLFLTFLLLCSATYGALGQWQIACDDAKECIRLNPTFVKGYYRLAAAQLELEEYEAAMATIRQGMAIDNNNAQLTKLLRIIQQQKKLASAKLQQQHQQQYQVPAIVGQMDSATAQELQELQTQQQQTSLELGTVQATAIRAQKEYKIASITRDELEQSISDESRCFRSIGKMFVRTTRRDMLTHLEQKMSIQSKLETDLGQKAEYLERQLKSQQQNIQELIGSSSSNSTIAAS
jgi:chaperonin cofactor prefoldin